MDNQELIELVYKNYSRWKFWGSRNFEEMAEVFEAEIKSCHLERGDHLLEIGFGEGLFLDWARSRGFEIEGLEINKELCEQAEKRGHKVYCLEFKNLVKNYYDCIVVLDVLEHLDKVEIYNYFNCINGLLKLHGKLLLRFPNGGSPFGRLNQNGDLSHKTSITINIIKQYSMITGFRLVEARNSVYSIKGGTIKKNLIKFTFYILKYIMEVLICYLYFGKRYPLDPNITVVLEKNEDNERLPNTIL